MNHAKQYLTPRCTPKNLDSYLIRAGIVAALKESLPIFSGTFLDVGCGFKPYRPLILSPATNVDKYIGLDLQENLYGTPDLTWDGRTIPLDDHTVDSAMATELLEHCPDPQAVLAEIFRVLKPGGSCFLTVPFLWPLHEVPHDYFRYTPHGLETLLRKVGFSAVNITPLGGWDAALAQVLGLWVSRRAIPGTLRPVLQVLLWPLYCLLIHFDKRPEVFRADTLFPGLAVTAGKPDSIR
jgi:SAM-dependent methyltransferase